MVGQILEVFSKGESRDIYSAHREGDDSISQKWSNVCGLFMAVVVEYVGGG